MYYLDIWGRVIISRQYIINWIQKWWLNIVKKLILRNIKLNRFKVAYNITKWIRFI